MKNITKNIFHICAHFVFWVWNLVFIGIMYIWFLPEIGLDLWLSARDGTLDPTFLVSFSALMIVPVICTGLAFWRLRKYPMLLLRLGYGVEAPLFTFCLLRMFVIRELTVASGFALGVVVVAIAMFAIELLSGYAAYRPRLAKVQMVSHSLMLLVGVHLGALLFLYSLPALVGFVLDIFEYGLWNRIGYLVPNPTYYENYLEFFVACLFGFLSVFSLFVFFSMPYTFIAMYVRAWARIRSAFGKQHGKSASWKITGITIALSYLLFVGLQRQPQIKAFNLLEPAVAQTEESGPTSEDITALHKKQLKNASTIKAGLTNAYLHHYRYLSPWSQSDLLKWTYHDTVGLSESSAQFVQNIHNLLVSPFLYRGEFDDDERAADLYAQFFDEPIQKGERPAIRKALQATANFDETQAGLLNLDDKVVRLASQSVTVKESGDWATVEIHEQYENPTLQDQEIFYSFSLPESATINGLWLGTAENPRLFPYVVSPRGAAQKVYKAEVERAKFQRATDPALLEQVGPRQYRLRVFPIPAAIAVDRETAEAEGLSGWQAEPTPGELHLTMTYQVMQQAGSNGSGQWPLPQLTEKRNIFWTSATEYVRDSGSIELSEDEWFEAAIPAKQAPAKTHKVTLTEGFEVTATPVQEKAAQLPADKRFAAIVDSSYSMGEHKEALKQAISQLTKATTNADFYLPVADSDISASAAKALIDVDNITFYGSLQPADMLQQFATQQDGQAYAAVLLLTDEGSYELANNDAELPELNAPLWLVHVDGKVPSAYEDGLLQQLQASKGGVETTIPATLQRIALTTDKARVLDGYSWTVEPIQGEKAAGSAAVSDPSLQDNKQEKGKQPEQKPSVGAPTEADSLVAIAARQLIYQQSQTLDVTEVAALDQVHEIAKRTGIVTPYSSMLVLVDERQREALRKAEASDDRFDRAVEDGTDELTEPMNPLSIPEPGQVLSLMVGAIALVLLKRKSKPARPLP